jgi:hypothetical protein
MVRAVESQPPPGAAGAMMVYSCAKLAVAAATANAAPRRACFISVSSHGV